MINAKIIGLAEINNYLTKTLPIYKRGLRSTMNDLARLLVNDVKANYLTKRTSQFEPKLNARHGNLKKSMGFQLIYKEDKVTAVIGTNVKYGKYNHDGAVIPPRRIYPKRKQALAWLNKDGNLNRFQAGALKALSRNKDNFKRAGGLSKRGLNKAIRADLMVVAKWVNLPQVTIPARPFLQTSFDKNKSAIVDRLFLGMANTLRRGR